MAGLALPGDLPQFEGPLDLWHRSASGSNSRPLLLFGLLLLLRLPPDSIPLQKQRKLARSLECSWSLGWQSVMFTLMDHHTYVQIKHQWFLDLRRLV